MPGSLGLPSNLSDEFSVQPHDRAGRLITHRIAVFDRCVSASGVETSLLGLAQALLRVMDSTLEPEFGPARDVNGVTRRLADVSLASRLLGWKAEVGLDDGLRRLVGWWRHIAAPTEVQP